MPSCLDYPIASAAVVCSRDLATKLSEALQSHAAWIVVYRNTPPHELLHALNRGADADIITIARRPITARLFPDAVCWRRDTLAAALAGGSSIPSAFLAIRRAQRQGARVLDLAALPADRTPFGPMWADATHQ